MSIAATGIRLIVGLGNPGLEYAQTRHNAGSWFLHEVASQYHAELTYNKKLFGDTAKVMIAGQPVHLFNPSTYMNESGKAVLAIAYYYKISPEEILVAHDELDFNVGTSKIKLGGGHGGHNGLRDIANRLQSKDFLRLRIGIAHPGHKDRVTGYVLSKPSANDRIKIDHSINSAIQIIEPLVKGQFEQACLELHSEE